MPYTVNRFDGTALTVVADGSINNAQTDVVLFGKGLENYSEYMSENLVHMIENYASTFGPSKPLKGQTWFNENYDELWLLVNEDNVNPANRVWKRIVMAATSDSVDAGTGLPDPVSESGDLYFVDPGETGSGVDQLGLMYVSDGTEWQPFAPLWQSSEPTVGSAFTFGTSANKWNQIFTEEVVVGGGTASPEAGSIRFTQANLSFEGFDGTVWKGLGGVIDVDQDTYITAEDSPGADNDQLKMYIAGSMTGMVDSFGFQVYNETTGQDRWYEIANAGGRMARIGFLDVAPDDQLAIYNEIGGDIVLAPNADNSLAFVRVDTAGAVLPQADVTQDIGSASLRWSTAYAETFNGVATEALYADLAERYKAKPGCLPGTVVSFSQDDDYEIEVTTYENFEYIFGVVSTDPGIKMNVGAGMDDTHPYVAFSGRVPCRVVGHVNKGDFIVPSKINPGCATAISPANMTLEARQYVIGRALQRKMTQGEDLIEIVVGVK